MPPAIEMRQIVKRFPGVLANDQVDLIVQQGEIHALLGENGAGKSTLMNMLNGLYQPDAGEIRINGQLVKFNSPRDAIRSGIGMVHQHFMLVPTQTVAENLILGQSHPRFLINYHQLNAQIEVLSAKFGLKIDPTAKIWQLSVGEQQRVEVLKMLYHGAKILIMDEPTAVLTPQEVVELFKTLRQMAADGHTIIFISHKLDEVMAIADHVTILRRGRVSAMVNTSKSSKAELARLMVGREVLFQVEKMPAHPTDPLLVLWQLRCDNDRGLPSLRGLDLTIRSGEIVGLAGVAGNGQTELAEVITGLRLATGGKMLLKGEDITGQGVSAGIKQAIAHIPADRTGVGTAPNLSLADNLILKSYHTPPISTGWSLNLTTIRQTAADQIKAYDVKAPSIETPARLLSGGNLQKLILAREFSLQPQLIVAVYPARGLDVGATEAVHRLLIQARDKGVAILLISEDLDELLSLSDRLAIIYEGCIVGELLPDESRIADIGLLMAGGKL